MITGDYHTESFVVIPQSFAIIPYPPKFGDPDPGVNNHVDAFVT
jgi:hypothetical protein